MVGIPHELLHAELLRICPCCGWSRRHSRAPARTQRHSGDPVYFHRLLVDYQEGDKNWIPRKRRSNRNKLILKRKAQPCPTSQPSRR